MSRKYRIVQVDEYNFDTYYLVEERLFWFFWIPITQHSKLYHAKRQKKNLEMGVTRRIIET